MAEVRLAKEVYDILDGCRLENIELKQQLARSNEENQALRAKIATLSISHPTAPPRTDAKKSHTLVTIPTPKPANDRPSRTITLKG